METIVSAKNSDGFEVAGAVIENLRTRESARRVNPYRVGFDLSGRPEVAVNQANDLGRMEYWGMLSMLDLFRTDNNWVVWVSPAGGMSGYTESRICLLEGVESEGRIEFRGWGICSSLDGEGCLKAVRALVERGARTVGEIGGFDDLRKTALGFSMPRGEIMRILEDVMGMPDVWRAIEDGGVDANKVEMEKVVADVLSGLPWEARRGMRDYDFQVYLELGLRQKGIYLMAGGVHGGSVLGGGVGVSGVFNGLFGRLQNMDSRLEQCSKCLNYYMKKKGECPKCKGN